MSLILRGKLVSNKLAYQFPRNSHKTPMNFNKRLFSPEPFVEKKVTFLVQGLLN